jgi:excisionase family DNA binding protein
VNAPSELLTYDQAAKALGCSYTEILRLLACGRINSVFVARNSPRVRYSQLKALTAKDLDP